jgi:hypothetical protein
MTKCTTLVYTEGVIVAQVTQDSVYVWFVHFNDALSGQDIIVSNGRMNMIGYGRKLPSMCGTVTVRVDVYVRIVLVC